MAQNIRFEGSPIRASDPATGAVAIDYSGGNQTLAVEARGIYISTAGHLNVTMRDGQTVLFSNLAAGQVYPFGVTAILQASSTAAGVVLL